MSDGQIKIKAQVEGLAEAANQIDNFSKRSQIALTSLNQVIQDLPFGFIGIQNNIPNLVQQFSLLTKDSKGFKNALLELGNAISGPIGLVAGASLLTTVLTTLVQKYGSLTTAFTEIFGIQKSLTDLQGQYNEELSKSIGASEAEKANLQSLAKIYLDGNSTLNQRVGAYDLLKKSYSEILPDIARETELTEEQTIAVKERIKLLLQEISLKGQQQALQNLISKNAEEAFTTLNKVSRAGFYDKLELLFKGLFQNGLQAGSAISIVGDTFSKTNGETQFYTKLLDDVNLKLSEVTKIINDATIAEKKRLQAIKDAKKLSEEKIKIEKKLADELLKEQQDRFNREDAAFKVLSEAYISTLTDRKKEEFKINQDYEDKRSTLLRANKFDFSAIEEEVRIKMKEVDDKYNQISLKDAEKAAKERLRIQEEIGKSARNQFESTFITKKGKSQQEKDAKDLENTYLSVGRTIFNNVINPLNQLFDVVLSKGEKSWQDFTASVVESLKKLLARLAAAAALAAILSAVSGGTATPGGVSFIKAFGSILGVNLGGGSVANPSFGGVQPGGMQMAGSVNMVLRGQDLVGSINRTNSQFSRVG
jgi:lambda family phage tail tape measure protein